MSKSAFGHSFLQNLTISRKFLVVFAVLIISLGAVATISMNGMREILGTFDRAATAYDASDVAGDLESTVARVIAAQSTYLRLGSKAQAEAVKVGLNQMKEHAEKLAELTADTPEADKVVAVEGIIATYIQTFDKLYKARQTRMDAAEEAAMQADQLFDTFAQLAGAAAKGGTLSLIQMSVDAYGTFARLNGDIVRYAGSLAVADETAAAEDLATLEKQVADLKTYAAIGGVSGQYLALVARLDYFKRSFESIRKATGALNESQRTLGGLDGNILVQSVALSASFAKAFDNAKRDLQSSIATAISTLMVLAGAVAMVSAALIWLISRSVSGPVGVLTEAMARLAKRDWATMVDGVARKDEIGRMASALQVFKESGQSADHMQAEMEAERTRTAQEQRAEMMDFADRFEKAIGAVVERVSNSAREMAALSEQLAAGVERTKVRSASAAEASQGAATNVQTVAAAVEELTTTVQEISRQVVQSHNATTDAVKVAGEADAEVSLLSDARRAHRRRHQDDHRDRGADQPAGAQRHHRGGARRRCRQGLRGGRGRGQEPRPADLARDRADHQPDLRDPELDPDHGRRHPRRRQHHPQGQRDLAGGGRRDRAAGRRDPGDRAQHPAGLQRHPARGRRHRRRHQRRRRQRRRRRAHPRKRRRPRARSRRAQQRARHLPRQGQGGVASDSIPHRIPHLPVAGEGCAGFGRGKPRAKSIREIAGRDMFRQLHPEGAHMKRWLLAIAVLALASLPLRAHATVPDTPILMGAQQVVLDLWINSDEQQIRRLLPTIEMRKELVRHFAARVEAEGLSVAVVELRPVYKARAWRPFAECCFGHSQSGLGNGPDDEGTEDCRRGNGLFSPRTRIVPVAEADDVPHLE